MPWVEIDKSRPGWLEWEDPTPAVIAEAITELSTPKFAIGDKIVIRATVSGQQFGQTNLVLDGVPSEFVRSFTIPAVVLAMASTKTPPRYIAPDTDAA